MSDKIDYEAIREILSGVGVTVKEALENFDANIKALNSVAAPPELIQGYTAEQWQEIIDGGYLCVIGDISMGHIRQIVSMGKNDAGVHTFKATSGFETFSCRPAQLKGVMRPIFVEPVDKGVFCVFFDAENCITDGISQPWNLVMPENKDNSVKYIEV